MQRIGGARRDLSARAATTADADGRQQDDETDLKTMQRGALSQPMLGFEPRIFASQSMWIQVQRINRYATPAVFSLVQMRRPCQYIYQCLSLGVYKYTSTCIHDDVNYWRESPTTSHIASSGTRCGCVVDRFVHLLARDVVASGPLLLSATYLPPLYCDAVMHPHLAPHLHPSVRALCSSSSSGSSNEQCFLFAFSSFGCFVRFLPVLRTQSIRGMRAIYDDVSSFRFHKCLTGHCFFRTL